MGQGQQAPYGSWASPVTAAMLATAGNTPDQIMLVDGVVYWTELRPTEGGRYVLMSSGLGGDRARWTPEGYNVRTRVHEYGGGAFCVHDGVLYFSNFEDQRLYRQGAPGTSPEPVTPEPPVPAGVRFADGRVSPDGRWLVCVRETHSEHDVVNELVAVDLGNGEQKVLVTGADFYSFPRLSPDGARLAFTTWDHPNMPWDATTLMSCGFEDGAVTEPPRVVAGGAGESIYQPEWSPGGVLHFVSDRSNWWNLYAHRDDDIVCVYEAEAEFGGPQWVFNGSNYDFLDEDRIAAIYTSDGIDHIGIVSRGRLEEIDTPYTSFRYPQMRAENGTLALRASSPTEPVGVRRIDAATGAVETLAVSMEVSLDPGYISVARPIEFPTEGGRTAYALYYPPTNRDFEGPAGARPPLLVDVHGGPTSQVSSGFALEPQFWTSRGFAVVDVNYGGSTGYGRDYRERLRQNWGVVDVEDCMNAARYLVREGEVDGDRVAVRGGSAGGYTTLTSLALTDFYAAGASHFGLGDLEAFVRITHKFESRYLDGLVGPYPEAAETYRARSAVPHADAISCPVILFQGLEDEVVPPAQAEQVVEALREKGLTFAYLAFPGEQHGFRRAETIERVAEAELFFYSRVFGFIPADRLEPVVIENL